MCPFGSSKCRHLHPHRTDSLLWGAAWHGQPQWYDYLHDLVFHDTLGLVELNDGGGQSISMVCRARLYDHVVTVSMDPSNATSGQLVEKGTVSFRYLPPDAEWKQYAPRLHALNDHNPHLSYSIHVGPFVVDGAYLPWCKQAYEYRLTFDESPFPDDRATTCLTLFRQLNAHIRPVLVFYTSPLDETKEKKAVDDQLSVWARAMKRLVVPDKETIFREQFHWTLDRSRCWSDSMIATVFDYLSDEPDARHQLPTAVPAYQMWQRYFKQAWTDGALSFEL